MTLEFWYMLPVSLGVATVAMATRISQHTLEKALGVLFILVAMLLLGKVAL